MGGTLLAIEKICMKYNLREEPSDATYWRSRPYAERLATLEEIRQEFHRWKYHAEPRLQRAYSITEQ